MIRTLFLIISFLFISNTLCFSQKDGDVITNKSKKTTTNKEKQAEKKRIEKQIKDNESSDTSDKAKKGNGNYGPTYGVASIRVRDSIYMLKGKGGNIGLFVGPEGAFMIDNQFAEGTDAILKTIGNLTDKPVRFLVNTHHHADHTGGNKNLLNEGVVILAQENVRKQLIEEAKKKKQDSIDKIFNKTLEKLSNDGVVGDRAEEGAKRVVSSLEADIALENNFPMITYEENLTFHLNGQKIFIFHIHKAHTDGDSVIYFTDSNVIHTGDLFVNGLYPFIDTANGGTYNGYVNSLSKIAMIADDETKIIPGHGEIASIKDVKYTQSMLEFLHSRVEVHYLENKTREQIFALNLTKDFDEKGFGKGFISTEKFFNFIFDDVEKKYKKVKSKE
ncbi:MAG: MBL fold metallo-hydrolase [Flavobacteriaceae bacterium]